MHNNKANGVVVDVGGMLQFLKGAKMPHCPPGGAYTINVMRMNPSGTNPQHR